MNKRDYKMILEKMREDRSKVESLSKDSKVLIVDGLNSFLRVFLAMPIVNEDGDHIGGYIGFLRSIAAAIRQFKPTRCIVVFDGKGGSHRRRSIHSGYKSGRAMPSRFNRREDVNVMTPEEELASMKLQMVKLSEYLDFLPITVMSLDHIEADDAIAYLTTEVFQPKGSEVIIMSDDKDFLQLVGDAVYVWRPVEKKFYCKEDVLNRFGVPSANFIHYKIFIGDSSDNIQGIKGIGPKTIQKKFPILLEDRRVDLDELLQFCAERKGDRIYDAVLGAAEQMKTSLALMNLRDLDISAGHKRLISDIAERPINSLNSFGFKRQFMTDRAYNVIPNVDSWLTNSFGTLMAYAG